MALYQCIVSFNSLVYFQRYGPDKLFNTTITKESYSVNTGDRVTILALCASLMVLYHSMYQVSFISIVYFQRYAPDKLFIAKMKQGSNNVNTVDMVMVFALCHSISVSSFIKLSSILLKIAPDESVTDGRTKQQLFALPQGA